ISKDVLPDQIDRLVARLSEAPKLARDVLGTEADFILRNYRSQMIRGRHYEAFSLVQRQIRAREGRLGLEIFGAMETYLKADHELEAWFLGQMERVPAVPVDPGLPVLETAQGRVSTTVDARGIRSDYKYDRYGDLIEVTRSDGTTLSTRDGRNWIEKGSDS